MALTAREEVARTVAGKSGWLRRASATGVLALLGAAALVPVVIEVAGGGPLAAALGGVAGNIGSGYLPGLIEKMADRLRNGDAAPPQPEAIRDDLAAELLHVLEEQQANQEQQESRENSARQLRSQLTELLMNVDGLDAVIGAARDDLRDHLLSCFDELTRQQGELAEQQREALRRLDRIGTGQRQQARQLRRQAQLTEEIAERMRSLTRHMEEWSAAAQPVQPPGQRPPPGTAALIVPAATPGRATPAGWQGGSELTIGDRVYLLHDYLRGELATADQSAVSRQARGLQLIPARDLEQGHVWLRQVEIRHRSRAAELALTALPAEDRLLRRLGTGRGLPQVVQREASGTRATLVLTWPASRSAGGPCETLATTAGISTAGISTAGISPDGTGTAENTMDRNSVAPVDSWHIFRLLTGLGGLCGTLATLHDHGAAHRALTPDAIIVRDDGRYALRDLGLAARAQEPGEGPAAYQAPEQQRRGAGRPGPGTDVYQLAAIAYHLITGYAPHPRHPPPLASQGPGRQGCHVPQRLGRAVDAALAVEPGRRPGMRELGNLLLTARDDLS